MRRFAVWGWALLACATSGGSAAAETRPVRSSPALVLAPGRPAAPPPQATVPVPHQGAIVPPPVVLPFRAPLANPADLLRGSAMRLANLPPNACLEKVRREKLPFKRWGKVDSIAAPLRFTGAIGEVTFQVPPEKTPFGLIDCRLALSLAEITPLLRAHQVKALRIDSFYRPKARLPAGHGKKSQHAYALAADVISVTLDDGRELDVERDFHGLLGAPVCGPEAYLEPVTDEAVRLRNLVCDLARRGAFHHMLTPNHDHAHRNHLHLDIKRDNKWFSLD